MTPHQILTVCIRLSALVWLLYIIGHLSELFAYTNSTAEIKLSKTALYLVALLQVGICALLWFLPRTIAAKLLPDKNAHDPVVPSSLVEWQTMVIVCLGIWALARAIPDAVYWITIYNMTSSMNIEFSLLTPEQKAGMISTVAEVVVGLLLLLGGTGISSVLHSIRNAGLKK